MPTGDIYLKWLLMVLLTLIWGSSFILIKKGLEGFAYMEAATIRMMSAGSMFIIPAFLYFKNIPKNKYWAIFLSALLGMFFPAYLFCHAQEHVQSVVAGLLNCLTPAFAILISVLVYKSRMKSIQIIGLILGLVCAMLLSFERSAGELSFNSYAIYIVLATISYGMNINLMKNHLQEVNSLSVSFVSVSIAGLLSFSIFFLPNVSNYSISEMNWKPFIYLCILGMCGTALAQIFFNRLIQITSPLFAGSVTFLMPLVALMWGILDGEALGIIHFFCIAGIIFSVYLVRKS